jgi:hypothetical protein
LFVKKFLVFKYLFQIENKTQFKTNFGVVNDLIFHSPVLDKLWKNKDFNRLYNLIFRDSMKNAILSGEQSTLDFIEKLAQVEVEITKLDSVPTENTPQNNVKLDKLFYQMYVLHSQGVNGQRLSKREKLSLNEEFEALSTQEKIEQLKKLLKGDVFTKLKEVYLQPLGIESFAQISTIYKQNLENTNKRNKQNSENPEELFSGSVLTKGVGSKYFSQILESGNNCSELLGASDGGTKLDFVTPLDIDLNQQNLTLEEEKQKLFSYQYMGHDLIFGIKDRGQFEFTEDNNIGLRQSGYYYNSDFKNEIETKKANFQGNKEEIFAKDYAIWCDKYEVFNVAADFLEHYCIRTGIASTEIDFMIFDPENKAGFESLKYYLARKGLYIPIYDRNRKLIFTQQDWQKYQQIFAGTQYSDQKLEIDLNQKTNSNKINQIWEKVKTSQKPEAQADIVNMGKEINLKLQQVLKENGIRVRNGEEVDIYGAEIIDAGSTGRGTNKAEGIDFDIAIVLDNQSFEAKKDQIFKDLNLIFSAATEKDGKESAPIRIELVGNTLRCYNVQINGQETDIDISLIPNLATKSIVTSDGAIKQKLQSIENKSSKETSQQVREQIILAKTVMSEYNCYKKNYDGENTPSGMGGVGVENWILANKGSFYEACKTFYQTAVQGNNSKPLELQDFKQRYQTYTYDAGTNLRFLGSEFTKEHDNYIFFLNQKGYENMLEMAKEVI